jgi:hypothetical protein
MKSSIGYTVILVAALAPPGFLSVQGAKNIASSRLSPSPSRYCAMIPSKLVKRQIGSCTTYGADSSGQSATSVDTQRLRPATMSAFFLTRNSTSRQPPGCLACRVTRYAKHCTAGFFGFPEDAAE